jgi:hypothetical protein
MQWRDRLAYLTMSLVVGWHCVAIVVAPAPDASAIVQSLRPVVQPYLSLFRLDTTWNFFAPSVGKHFQFRYIIDDDDGNGHAFVPTEEWDGSLPSYVLWREFKYLYEGIMESPETRAEGVAALLCRKHTALKPVSVTLLQIQERDFWPEDQLRGMRPLDPEFIAVKTLARVACRSGSAPLRRSPIRPVRPA